MCSEPNTMEIRKFRDFPPFLALSLALGCSHPKVWGSDCSPVVAVAMKGA